MQDSGEMKSGPVQLTTGTNLPVAPAAAEWRYLTICRHALPPDLLRRTDVMEPFEPAWWERGLEQIGLQGLSRRLYHVRGAFRLLRSADGYAAVVSAGNLGGFVFAALLRLRGERRPVHVMEDCLWYGGGALRRAWVRFCLQAVDRCVVWASIECKRYARAYGVPEEKFVFVPHHNTLKNQKFDVRDDGYVFAGGNFDRDWKLLLEAMRGLDVPLRLVTNRLELLRGLEIPPTVQAISATPHEFRQLMAASSFVVLPMRSSLLHAGGQQTMLNAEALGKPVILTDPEGGRDYIEHGRTGLLVPYGDVEALRAAIRRLWENREELRVMSQRAREFAATLTTEATNTMIWKLVAELVRARQEAGSR